MKRVLISLSCAVGLQASATTLSVYPVSYLLGTEQECRTTTTVSAVDCRFVMAMQAPHVQDKIKQQIVLGMQQQLPEMVVSHIDQSNKVRTFVASFEVIRASHYTVPKASTTEIFLPVTLALKITNILTGEVTYSNSLTDIQPIQVLSEQLDGAETQQRILLSYQQSVERLLQQLITPLQAQFKLSNIDATVSQEPFGYLILNRGIQAGLNQGDELSGEDGSLIRIVWANEQRSVAVPVLVNPQSYQHKTFSKWVTTTKQSANKPKALIADVASFEPQLPQELIEELFSGLLNAQSAFTLTPINRRFSTLQHAVIQSNQLQQVEVLQKRKVPNLFMRLSVFPIDTYQQAKGSITTINTLHARILGELIDSNGRVLFAALGEDQRQDQISDGIGLSLESRKEIVAKNALLNLSEKFQQQLSLRTSTLALREYAPQQWGVHDPHHLLQQGQNLTIYRPIDDQGQSVMLPIWEARIEKTEQTTTVKPVISLLPNQQNVALSAQDIVLITQTGTHGNPHALAFCPHHVPEQKGEVSFAYTALYAHAGFALQAAQPFVSIQSPFSSQHTLPEKIQELADYAGFEKTLTLNMQPPAHCLNTIYKIEPQQLSCSRPDQCDAQLKINAGIRLLKDQQLSAPVGQAVQLKISNTPTESQQQVFRLQAASPLLSLFTQIATSSQLSHLITTGAP
jgi:hypothetical protein